MIGKIAQSMGAMHRAKNSVGQSEEMSHALECTFKLHFTSVRNIKLTLYITDLNKSDPVDS